MREAYILISTDVGTEHVVMDKVKTVQGVTEGYIILGVYDLIIRIQADTLDELKSIITKKIRNLDDVRTTLTMIVI